MNALHNENRETRNITDINVIAADKNIDQLDIRYSLHPNDLLHWKMTMFYRWKISELRTATKRLLVSVGQLGARDLLYAPSPMLERSRRRIYEAVSAALSEAEGIAEDYDALHHAASKYSRLDIFHSLLRHCQTFSNGLGARIGRIEDALTFWSTHAPGETEGVDTHGLERFMLSFERHLAPDLKFPNFKLYSPGTTGRDFDPTPCSWAAQVGSSRLKL